MQCVHVSVHAACLRLVHSVMCGATIFDEHIFRNLIEIFSDVFQLLMSCWTCDIISLVCLATGGPSYKGGPSLF